MNYVYHNGEYKDSSKPIISVDNRAFHYADGFFESIRVVNGKPCFLESHFSRIEESIQAYSMDEAGFSKDKLKKEILEIIDKNEITQGGRIRITFSRKANGYYSPDANTIEYYIEAYALENNYFHLNDEGKTIDIYPEMQKQINSLSMYKNLSSSLFILASLYAKQKNIDISLINNYKGTIIEATNANIFIVSNRVLYTPSLADGCTAGTMRMNVINIALENGLKTYECVLNPQYLLTADEVFLTNAIEGITWVSSYRSKRYFNNLSKELLVLLNKHVSEMG